MMKNKFFHKIQLRFSYIGYTLRHKKAFLTVEKRLCQKNTLAGYLHDLDKVFLYLAFWIDVSNIQKIHTTHSRHHLNNTIKKTRKDYIQTLIDWECARLTKPDKQLNAYQTLIKIHPEYIDIFLPLIQEFLPHQIPDKCIKRHKKTS